MQYNYAQVAEYIHAQLATKSWSALRGYILMLVGDLIELCPPGVPSQLESSENIDEAIEILYHLTVGFREAFPEADAKLPFLLGKSEVEVLLWEMVLYDLHTYLIYLVEPATTRPDVGDIYKGLQEKLARLEKVGA